MKRTAWVAVLVALAGFATQAQVVRYIDGIFLAPRTGAPVELIAYAEQTSVGRLRMAEGTLDDAPLIHEAVSVLAVRFTTPKQLRRSTSCTRRR